MAYSWPNTEMSLLVSLIRGLGMYVTVTLLSKLLATEPRFQRMFWVTRPKQKEKQSSFS